MTGLFDRTDRAKKAMFAQSKRRNASKLIKENIQKKQKKEEKYRNEERKKRRKEGRY
ncbi:hypothetical protein KKG83_05275 [Candidatus Micrarchaeota archaeon]|nr:hypothetical protein [Candidatus Micrarchaeota archaeon]MBU2476855.1 hypothetical protein [Candidatus Micrarchaeota archaeon]